MEENRMIKNVSLKRLLLLAFALSGMAALIYEVVWIRALKLIFGSTAFSISIMFTTLFFGFALGSYLLRKKADTHPKPVYLLFLIELIIGVYGIALIFFLKILPLLVASLATPIKYVIVFLLLLTPATLLGALWPIFYKVYVKNIEMIGKDSGILYFANSMGAAFGAFASGFILIPLIGVTTTSLFASVINISIALAFFSIRKEGEQ
ncbi:hypothetical protein JYT91_01095 [archaeon AH-315-M20]|nr:hypothetical protein [archaeon AH-315-M20]